MRVVIAGATGFIGRALCHALSDAYEVVALTRNTQKARPILPPNTTIVQWDPATPDTWSQHLDATDAIVDLVGENIAARRWTQARKTRIIDSRTTAAKALLAAVTQVPTKPKVVILGSAIGYYGSSEEPRDESSPPGCGFLADVCQALESCGPDFEALNLRTILLRTGVVLGPDGGALPKMALPFKFHLGGHIGNGRQWISWVSLADEVAAIRHLIENESAQGAYNVTAPGPVRTAEFFRTLGRAMRRRSWTAMPAFVARLVLGEMADEMLLASQRITPTRLTDLGFTFKDTDLQKTLDKIYERRRRP